MMDGEQFYDEYKDALKYLGIPWGKKSEATVAINGDRILIAWNGRDVSFTVGKSVKLVPGPQQSGTS